MLRFAFAGLALAASLAQAAHPLITEDTGTQGAGRWQLEGTAEREKQEGTREVEDLNAFVLARGFAEHADWIVALPWYRTGKDGVGDVSLDLKWRFFERGALSLGLKPGATLPTGDERAGRGAGKATWGALLIASYEPGPLSLHAHAGYRANRNKRGERDALRQYAAAAAYAIGKVKLIVDASRSTNPDPAVRGGARSLVLGAIWGVRKDFDLDAGVKSGHGSAALDHALLLGATVRW